jgi:3-phosphoinositide dependent protein kinase-1
LNTNRWFCIPQIAILFGYLKPPCLLIDFIKGEKKYLPIDDTMRISTDGVFYVRNYIYKILESASFFYKFKDAEARPINWV